MNQTPEQSTSTIRPILIVWVVLILFTLTGYFSSEELCEGRTLAIVLMLLTAVKFIGVSFWFMEAKDAHPAWKWILIFVLLLFSLVIIFTS